MFPLARTDEQRMLETTLARFLAAPRRNDVLWPELARDLGLMGIGIADTLGGHGGGDLEIAIAAAQLGKALVAEPWLETMTAARLLAQASDRAPTVFDAIAAVVAGDARIALLDGRSGAYGTIAARATRDGWVVDGEQRLLVGAADATHLIVAAATEAQCPMLLLVDVGAAGVHCAPRSMADASMTADIILSGVALTADALVAIEQEALDLAGWAQDALIAGRCAEVNGIVERMLGDTLRFVHERRQFGKPIARFQALRHRLVDMRMEAIKAEALTAAAIASLEAHPDERARAASAAKLQMATAARVVGEGAIQIHGAMGLTEELDLGRAFKRARYRAALGGSVEDHLLRYAMATAA